MTTIAQLREVLARGEAFALDFGETGAHCASSLVLRGHELFAAFNLCDGKASAGIARYDLSRRTLVKHYRQEDGLDDLRVHCLREVAGALWAAGRGGLYLLGDDDRWRQVLTLGPAASAPCVDMTDAGGEIYAIGDRGLVILDVQRNDARLVQGLRGTAIATDGLQIFLGDDQRSDALTIVSKEGIVNEGFRYNASIRPFIHSPSYVRAVHCVGGQIFVGGQNGLFIARFAPNFRMTRFRSPKGKTVLSLSDLDGQAVVGYMGDVPALASLPADASDARATELARLQGGTPRVPSPSMPGKRGAAASFHEYTARDIYLTCALFSDQYAILSAESRPLFVVAHPIRPSVETTKPRTPPIRAPRVPLPQRESAPAAIPLVRRVHKKPTKPVPAATIPKPKGAARTVAPPNQSVTFQRRYTTQDEKTGATFTYDMYAAPSESQALEFLNRQEVKEPLRYVVVETQDRNWGRDCHGIYCENQDAAQKQRDVSLDQLKGSAVRRVRKDEADNCSRCGHRWIDVLRTNEPAVVRCPKCGATTRARTNRK